MVAFCDTVGVRCLLRKGVKEEGKVTGEGKECGTVLTSCSSSCCCFPAMVLVTGYWLLVYWLVLVDWSASRKRRVVFLAFRKKEAQVVLKVKRVDGERSVRELRLALESLNYERESWKWVRRGEVDVWYGGGRAIEPGSRPGSV